MSVLDKNIIKHKKILSEIQLDEQNDDDWSDSEDDEVEDVEKQKQKDANLIVSQCSPFKIAENVEAIVSINKEKESEEDGGVKSCVKIEEFEIKISLHFTLKVTLHVRVA